MSCQRLALGLLAAALAVVSPVQGLTDPARDPGPAAEAYRTPYQVAFTIPAAVLTGDLDATERGDPRREAEIPFAGWYAPPTLKRWHGWGPHARAYPPPPGLEGWSPRHQRERVVAVALRYVGYGYQHHHVPDWDPPPGWPWQPTCAGRNGRGVDCSNFTGFVFNLGFGLRLSTEVERQAGQLDVRGPGGGRVTPIRRVELPDSFEARRATLRTGDLVFIRGRAGRIAHVVIWVGALGRSPDGVPLVIDSHGSGVQDSRGHRIPCGIRLRPFREDSWYNRSASHALRMFPGP